MSTVKTYRAKMQQNVGGNVRQVGDYIPEAMDWHHSVLATYVRAGFVEETYVDSDELDQALQVQRAADGEYHGEHEEAPEVVELPDDASETEEEDDSDDETPDDGAVQRVKLRAKKGR